MPMRSLMVCIAAQTGTTRLSRSTCDKRQESGMNRTRPIVIAVGFILGGQLAFAQDISRYRVYALESRLDSVVAASGVRAADAKTLHERPATIQVRSWNGARRTPIRAARLPIRCARSPSRST